MFEMYVLKNQEYILFLGDLIPRHMQVFRSNDFFAGVTIPETDVTVSYSCEMNIA